MGKHDFEVELPQDPPDPEALHAPVERTGLQNCITWLTLLPVVGCAVVGLVYGWSLSAVASAEITRITDLVANASTAIAPYAADLQLWSLPPADVETVWRSAQSERLDALKDHLNGTRLLMGLAGFALLPAFVIWNRGQFGRPEGSPRLDVVQVGLCLLCVGGVAGAWHYDLAKYDAVIKVGSAQGLGVRAKALAAEGKAKHLAPWRKTLDEALASLRPPLEAGVDYAKVAETVTASVHEPEFGLITEPEKLALRQSIESLAQAHFTGAAFEPLARAQEPFIGRNGVAELLIERERESRTFATDDEAAEYLFNAIRNDNEAEVRMMIRRGIDVDVLKPGSDGGYTPLHAAVFYRRPGLARLFVERCARTDIPCGGTGPLAPGDFPLHTAVGDPGLMKLLLDHRADPNATNAAGRTPLHVAAFCGDRTSIKLLAARNANVNALDDACQTPLDLANDPTATDAARGALALLQQLGGRLATDLQPADADPVATTPQQ